MIWYAPSVLFFFSSFRLFRPAERELFLRCSLGMWRCASRKEGRRGGFVGHFVPRRMSNFLWYEPSLEVIKIPGRFLDCVIPA